MQLEAKIKSSIRDVQDYPKPGIIFKDITPVLAKPELVREIVKNIVSKYADLRIDAIAAIEARGFILGSIIAHELNCRFIPIRKLGKLPFRTLSQEYTLEYGSTSVEMHEDAVQDNWRVVIHDDLLATGGTAAAAAELVKRLGGEVIGFNFLINLSFLPGEKNLKEKYGIDPYCLVSY
jgi:adenine phosphoribosyltransferase